MDNSNIIQFPAAAPRAARAGETNATLAPAKARVIDLSALLVSAPPSTRALQAVDVWEAVTENRVAVHYQPQYDIRSGEMVAAEALVRLLGRDGALIFPDRFIDLVERHDLIVPLGRAVISQVCADLAATRAQGIELQRVAINLAARQLEQDLTLLDFVDLELYRHQLSYRDLEFELTERQHLAPNDVGIAQLEALAERGSRIVLDDFGIGYSSVIYLTELPISAFKLDRALVERVPNDRATASVVKSLLALAAKLGLVVIAEGAETTEQNQFLMHAGCPYAQGFGYARPMPIDALRAFETNHQVPSKNKMGA